MHMVCVLVIIKKMSLLDVVANVLDCAIKVNSNFSRTNNQGKCMDSLIVLIVKYYSGSPSKRMTLALDNPRRLICH